MNLLIIFISCLLIILCAFFYAITRGLKTVRAYVYLMQIEHGLDSEMANAIACSLSSTSASEYRSAAMKHCHTSFNGSQLEMIKLARSKGFAQ